MTANTGGKVVRCTLALVSAVIDRSAVVEFGIEAAVGWDQRACDARPTIIGGKSHYGGPASA